MQEIKWATLDTAGTADSSLGYIQRISPNILQGTSKNNRIGDRVSSKHVSFRLTVILAPLGVGPYPQSLLCRWVIFTMKQPPAAVTPVLNEIFDTPANALCYPLMNSNSTSASFIKSKLWATGLQSATAVNTQSPTHKVFHADFRFRNKMSYVSSLSSISSDPKDVMYLAIITNNLVAGNCNILYSWNCRQSFRDA